jgi:hypothetical protein
VHLRPLVACAAAAVAGAATAAWLTAPEPVPGIANAGATVGVGIAVARLLVELGAALCVGTALLPVLTGRRTGPAQDAVARDGVRLGVAAAATWLAGAVASVVLLAAELSPGRPVTVGAVTTYVRTFGTGQALLLGAAAAALCLVLAALPRVPAVVRAVPAALGLVPLAAAGHASSGTTAWHAVMGDLLAVHVLAAAAWVGGLVAVLVTVAPRPTVLAVALPASPPWPAPAWPPSPSAAPPTPPSSWPPPPARPSPAPTHCWSQPRPPASSPQAPSPGGCARACSPPSATAAPPPSSPGPAPNSPYWPSPSASPPSSPAPPSPDGRHGLPPLPEDSFLATDRAQGGALPPADQGQS